MLERIDRIVCGCNNFYFQLVLYPRKCHAELFVPLNTEFLQGGNPPWGVHKLRQMKSLQPLSCDPKTLWQVWLGLNEKEQNPHQKKLYNSGTRPCVRSSWNLKCVSPSLLNHNCEVSSRLIKWFQRKHLIFLFNPIWLPNHVTYQLFLNKLEHTRLFFFCIPCRGSCES